MAQDSSGNRAFSERFREFEQIAHELGMPIDERLSILNVSRATYLELRMGLFDPSTQLTAQLERRLSYALPLMRRLAASEAAARATQPKPDVQLKAA